jgi:hypothetical protein
MRTTGVRRGIARAKEIAAVIKNISIFFGEGMEEKQEPHVPIRHLEEGNSKSYYHVKTLEAHSERVSMMCYIAIVLSLAITVIAAVVFVISKTVPEDRKVFVFTILTVGTLGIWIVLIVTRNDTNVLLVFTNISMLLSGTVLGLTIGYI